MAPLALALLLALMIGNWIVAGQAAQDLIYDRMASAALAAAHSVPNFVLTGQNLATQISTNPGLCSDDPIFLSGLLEKEIKNVTFFSQLSIIGKDGNLIVSYPTISNVGAQAP